MGTPFLLLNERDVRAVLTMPGLIDAMESALVRFSRREAEQPVRTVLKVNDEPGYFATMPASIRATGEVGAKLVTFYPRNGVRGVPTHLATIVLLDAETGALTAVMDGRYITEARTGAVSAVAVRYLASPDARKLAILGSGVQARSHLSALASVRRFEEIRVWSPTRDHLTGFVDEMAPVVKGRLKAAASAEESVVDADVVVLATNATAPPVLAARMKPDVVVVSVGACRPEDREIDPALLEKAWLVVDSRDAAMSESGDIVRGIAEGRFGPDHIRAELGELIFNRMAAPSSVPRVFKSLGLAVEDVTAAALAYRLTREGSRGTLHEL